MSIEVKTVVRILLVEDSEVRASWFRMTAKGRRGDAARASVFRFVWAKAAGSAIGILKRDPGRVYAGILLDHDLMQQKITDHDAHYNGKDVVDAIIEHVDPSVPVWVHSANITEGPKMADRLRKAGFLVEQAVFSHREPLAYQRWLNQAAEMAHEEMTENPLVKFRARMRASARAKGGKRPA